jgi:hypothetical protein
MFTILKVRENLSDYDTDPGWYENPPGTQATTATDAALRRDSIAADGSGAPKAPAGAMKSWQQAPGRGTGEGSGHGHQGDH